MKVLMITDTHDPHAGGAEKYFFRLKKELQKKGIEGATLDDAYNFFGMLIIIFTYFIIRKRWG